jgi:hypothetical protein
MATIPTRLPLPHPIPPIPLDPHRPRRLSQVLIERALLGPLLRDQPLHTAPAVARSLRQIDDRARAPRRRQEQARADEGLVALHGCAAA